MSPEEILNVVLRAAALTGTTIVGIKVHSHVLRAESIEILSRADVTDASTNRLLRISTRELSEMTVEQLSEKIDDS
jgi:hypothetical protein